MKKFIKNKPHKKKSMSYQYGKGLQVKDLLTGKIFSKGTLEEYCNARGVTGTQSGERPILTTELPDLLAVAKRRKETPTPDAIERFQAYAYNGCGTKIGNQLVAKRPVAPLDTIVKEGSAPSAPKPGRTYTTSYDELVQTAHDRLEFIYLTAREERSATDERQGYLKAEVKTINKQGRPTILTYEWRPTYSRDEARGNFLNLLKTTAMEELQSAQHRLEQKR